jgi:hypothetical protein
MNRCETCTYRNATGHCTNKKLDEDWGQTESERQDMLVYDFSEGGGFWVGPQFGCVHHSSDKTLSR